MIGLTAIIIAIIAIGYLIIKSLADSKKKEYLARLDISAKDIANCKDGTDLQKIILQRLYQKASLIFWRIYNNLLVLFPSAEESAKNGFELFKNMGEELKTLDYNAIIDEKQKMEKIFLEIEIPRPETPKQGEAVLNILNDATELDKLTLMSIILMGNDKFDIGIKVKVAK